MLTRELGRTIRTPDGAGMSIVSIRHLAVASLALLLAACGGESGGEKGGGAQGGDSAAAAAGDSAAGAPRQAAVPSPRTKAPPIIRGLYVNAYKAGSGTHRRRLIEIADQTEINAFVAGTTDEEAPRGFTRISNRYELHRNRDHPLIQYWFSRVVVSICTKSRKVRLPHLRGAGLGRYGVVPTRAPRIPTRSIAAPLRGLPRGARTSRLA